MKNKIESIVIINHNNQGFSATLRYSNKAKDVCLSSTMKVNLYMMIEDHVARSTR